VDVPQPRKVNVRAMRLFNRSPQRKQGHSFRRFGRAVGYRFIF
jgi:hypothetical protein